MTRTLTLQQLIKAKACKEQRDLFEATFGSEVQVSVELALSVASKFDWNWAANNLLSAPAWSEYKKVQTSALAEYDKAVASAGAEYRKATASALAEYYKAVASAGAEYKRAIASAFAKAYINNSVE